MSAVVAIGGARLLNAVNAYRALVPSDVWVLGLTTPRALNDQQVRSLEALLQPFMQAYFAAEAQVHVAAISAELTALLLPARNVDPDRTVNAVSPTMWKDVAAVLALVAMLDSAHALTPIELVMDDDSGALARTAVAWARAHGVPSVTLAARVPVRRPRKPVADRTIVVGEQGRRAYTALDVDQALLVNVAPAHHSFAAGAEQRGSSKSAAKAALQRVLGWPETDIVVAFEPATTARDSALEPADTFHVCLASMFSAFVQARMTIPTMRLAIVGAPSPEGGAIVAQAALAAGLVPGDFAYGETDYDVWMAAADIAVSLDSARSIDAAIAGVAAINLWRAASWYLGPAFPAEDGILDVAPNVLGATLVALAGDTGLRSQIAALAGERVASRAATEDVASAIASELIKRRRLASTIISKRKPDFVIYAPPYANGSAGLRALYRLCHFINMLGGDASIYPGTQLHPTWNTPRRDTSITDKTIVVYPEIYFQMLPAKRVVRWCLNKPGLLGGPTSYGADEMVFFYHEAYRAAAQAATAEVLSDERELYISVIDPELFYNDRSLPRLYDCVFLYKGRAIYDRVQPRQIRDAYVIQSGWPASRADTAALLRGCRRLYSFDASSAVVMEAMICGAHVSIVREDGELGEPAYDFSDYERLYYDMSPVERFLRLVSERWT